jgi:hypothetical protein
MATANAPKGQGTDVEAIRDAWMLRLTALVDDVERWARELGWSTRRIEKKLEDHEIGLHKVPALLLQEGTVRVLLDPIARSAIGAEGVVDLYLMPAFDDIATILYRGGNWRLYFAFEGSPANRDLEADSMALSKETLKAVLREMLRNAE